MTIRKLPRGLQQNHAIREHVLVLGGNLIDERGDNRGQVDGQATKRLTDCLNDVPVAPSD